MYRGADSILREGGGTLPDPKGAWLARPQRPPRSDRPPGGRGEGGAVAARPRGARPPDGARPPAPREAPPTPHPVPHPAPRQPGGGVSQGRQRWWRLGSGSHLGGEEAGRSGERGGRRPARPALWPRGGSGGNKTFPARGRGRGGEGRGGGEPRAPGWAGPLPLPPGAGEPIRPPRPLLCRTP